MGLGREERTSGLWGNRARGGGVNAHLYCWTGGELTVKGKSNPEPAILCCLMPYGDTTEPRGGFPRRRLLQKVQHLSPQHLTWRQATQETSKTKRRPGGRSQHGGGGVCVPRVLHMPPGGGAGTWSVSIAEAQGRWAVVERFLPVLGHPPPSCSLSSLPSACVHPAAMLRSMRTLRPGGKLCQEELFCSSRWQLGRCWSTLEQCRVHVDLGSPQGIAADRNQTGRVYRRFGSTCRSEGVWGTGSEVFFWAKATMTAHRP